MSVINTNVKAMTAQHSLSVNNRSLSTAMQQLSTGKRINSAKDDAAGLAISTRMSADLRGMSMAIKNANDGISMMQTAEGALGEITNMLQRMRELSVQAATGSMTADNRKALQKEMDQLIAEIDNVARTTNFNGIKLLDGSAKDVKIQTNVKENDQVGVSISSASSKSLGLQGYRIEGELTSGRVGTVTGVNSESDVLINGKNFTTNAALPAADTAKALADGINANSGEHRVVASAYNTLKGVAPSASSFASGALTVNGNTIAAAGSVEELVSNINRDAAGVSAVLGSDGTIELSNDTGENIVIAGAATESAGFTAGTYTGYVTLTSMDQEDITVQAKSVANGFVGGSGTIADVKALGFNETKDGTAFTGTAVDANKIELDDDLRINGVRVGPSADSSARAKASAINEISGETGVTASAKTEVVLTYDMNDIADGDDVNINGVEIDLSAETDVFGVVDKINDANAGVVASTDTDGRLILTAYSGDDIRVSEAAAPFFTAIASLTGDASTGAGTAASPFVVKGRITLDSEIDSEIRIEGKSAGAAALIGLAEQGGSSTLVGGELSIRTQEAAGRSITAIDEAIDSVAMERANLGAFQNRLTAAVDNLSSSRTNLAESQSRILDADYAQATTELARTQIIQQAATAMLAQANQQPQSVLALLQ
jgi:flagellin